MVDDPESSILLNSVENGKAHPSLAPLLDDLCSRFIVNCPEEDYCPFERICFQLELALWFYEDFYREKDLTLPVFSHKDFILLMFQHCPLLRSYASRTEDINAIYKKWLTYKARVPSFGAIILNKTLDKCLLVKGFSYGAKWGFPKGKINKDEAEVDCAAREVLEETAYDLTGLINEEDYIENSTYHDSKLKLFIVPFVDERIHFKPLTRKEISQIEWHEIQSIPTTSSYHSSSYANIIPFLSDLKKWINRKKIELRNNPNGMTNKSKRILRYLKDDLVLNEFSPVGFDLPKIEDPTVEKSQIIEE